MATAASENSVQQLYIAYFGRPADPAGLAFYADALDAGTDTLANIADSFALSTEAAAIVALDTDAFLTSFYQNAFGRAYDTSVDGTFWADAINNNEVTKEQAMVEILGGASAVDAATSANKTEVAVTYTTAVEADGATYTADEIAAAQAILTAVTDDAATVTTGNAAAAAEVADNVPTEADALVAVAAEAAYAEFTIAADATAGEVAVAEALTLTTAEAAIAAGGTQLEIDAAYDILVSDGADALTLANVVALSEANAAVDAFLAAVDIDEDPTTETTSGAVHGTNAGVEALYNSMVASADAANDSAVTAAALLAAQVATNAAALAVDEAAVTDAEAAIAGVDGLAAGIAAVTAATATDTAADTTATATQATLNAAEAAYNVNNGTAVLNADGTVSDTDMVSIGTIVDGDGSGVFGAFTVTVSALAAGQSVTIAGTTVTAEEAMTATAVGDAVAAAVAVTGFTAANTAGDVLYTWGVDEVTDTSADTTDDITLSIGGTEATNEGLAALVAANVADLAADAAVVVTDAALTAAEAAEPYASDASGADLATDYTDAVADVTAAQLVIDTLTETKDLLDLVGGLDDVLLALEVTQTAAAAAVDEVSLADGTNAMGGNDVVFVDALVAGDVSDVTGFDVTEDSLYFGETYTVNTGALTTGDNDVLEMFISEGATAADTLLTFETAAFGSASEGDFFTVELTGVTVAEITTAGDLLVGA